jgi:beta-lactamase regulating signal transducer with metallopeptidase domain
MHSIQLIRIDSSFLFDVAWQSSLCLVVGLAASVVAARRSARAHRALLLAAVAALVTPVLAQGARLAGWGILASAKVSEPGASDQRRNRESTAASVSEPRAITASPATERRPFSLADDVQSELSATDSWSDRSTLSVARTASAPAMVAPIDWRSLAVVVWSILAGLAAMRMVVGILLGVQIVRRATQLPDQALATTAAIAAARLRVACAPELRVSSQVRCPSIWCWQRRPVIVVPELLAAGGSVDWAGIFCHELAHWVRRDHWSGLCADVLVCALPWHPLAWWTKRRLGELAELACDDWVLSTGVAAPDYAESLLGLVPQRSGSLALAAVTGRRGLVGRVRHILDERHASPFIGKRWAWLSAGAVILAAATLALAQTRPELTRKDTTNLGAVNSASTRAAAGEGGSAMKNRTIRGTVIGPDGKPASGATVLWLGQPKRPVAHVALPRDHPQANQTGHPEVVARSETGPDGSFTLAGEFDRTRYELFNGWQAVLLVKFPGAGILVQKFEDVMSDVTLRLEPEVVVHGRLLTPSGKPAPGVRILLRGCHDQDSKGMYVGFTAGEEMMPSYWPRSNPTDADGRFKLEGIPRGSYATIEFWPTDHAVDEVVVSARTDGAITPGMRSSETVPVSPTFTHTLEPARPVQGRVTDRQTGRPVADVMVEVIPMRRHGGMSFDTRTDADGRYRVSGHQAEKFFISVYPRADSGYLGTSDQIEAWPAGAKFAEKNFALNRGRIVLGQVIEAGTGKPVGGAGVVYQPARGNPHDTGEYELRNTVLTGQDGRFSITTLPAKGFLATETADENYIRVLYKESRRGSVYPQGLTAIDVPETGEPQPAKVEVRRGVTLEAQAVGPDGRRVSEITVLCKGIDAKLIDVWNESRSFEDGVFRLPGADPGKTYRVFILQFKKKLGAVAELRYDPTATGPIEVALQSTAKFHGEVVAAGGSPAMGGQVLPYVLLEKDQSEFKENDVYFNRNAHLNVHLFPATAWGDFYEQANLKGNFRFDRLIAGVRYGLSVRTLGRGGESMLTVQPLSPGEDRDLGKITPKEPHP